MDRCGPDFIVIGAMKCATTTLHEQLARQPGIFMTTPKEPNFFSDDAIFARGIGWYRGLFEEAGDAVLRGESSTHYTKLPTYPWTVERMRGALPRLKLVYVMRHPIDRLVSHYVHQRSLGDLSLGIEEAVVARPEFVQYGLYSMQLRPFLEAYGPENVLPVFFGRLTRHPQEELERIGKFLGYPGQSQWDLTLKPQNVGRERLRRSPVREALVQAPVLTSIRRKLVPKSWTEPVKRLWRIRFDPPALSRPVHDRLRDLFDPDLAELGVLLGIDLDCASFKETTTAVPHDWVRTAASPAAGPPPAG